jgi:transposase
MAIWQDLVDDHGFTARYASVRRFVVTLRGTSSPEARVVITTAPGEEAQVDYGDGPMVRHPETGKYRRTRLFVLTLGYSRKAVRLLVWQSSTQIWAELHERAFRRLGGTVRVIVLDNLKEGVLTAGHLRSRTQSAVPRRARALRRCRGAVPRRRSRPQGQVEAGVGHAKKTPLLFFVTRILRVLVTRGVRNPDAEPETRVARQSRVHELMIAKANRSSFRERHR